MLPHLDCRGISTAAILPKPGLANAFLSAYVKPSIVMLVFHPSTALIHETVLVHSIPYVLRLLLGLAWLHTTLVPINVMVLLS